MGYYQKGKGVVRQLYLLDFLRIGLKWVNLNEDQVLLSIYMYMVYVYVMYMYAGFMYRVNFVFRLD